MGGQNGHRVRAQKLIMKKRLRLLSTFNEVLDVLDGPVAVGNLTETSCACVCNWRSYNGLFPPKYYFVMDAALRARGYTAPRSLWGFYGTKRQRKTDRQQEAA